jgi:hypothetical protein
MLSSRYIASVGLLATLGLWTTGAHASVPVSLDLDYALPVDAGAVDDGFGGALRFGPRLDLKLLNLGAEVGLGIHDMSGPLGPTVYRGVIGARLGLAILVRPTVFAHIGVGHADWDTTSDLTHLTLDAGGALDFTVVPAVEVGAHLAYNLLFGNGSVDSFGFLTIGGHLTVILDRD